MKGAVACLAADETAARARLLHSCKNKKKKYFSAGLLAPPHQGDCDSIISIFWGNDIELAAPAETAAICVEERQQLCYIYSKMKIPIRLRRDAVMKKRVHHHQAFTCCPSASIFHFQFVVN